VWAVRQRIRARLVGLSLSFGWLRTRHRFISAGRVCAYFYSTPSPPHPHPPPTTPTPTPRNKQTNKPTKQGPGRIPASRSGEILDLSKDTFHHPAVREPWCELSPPLAGWGAVDALRGGGGGGGGDGSGALKVGGAYERIRDDAKGTRPSPSGRK
jgi:hypothetical protein